MTVLVEQYWREISTTLAGYDIPVRHFVLHTDPGTLRARIETDVDPGPVPFRLVHLEPYVQAFRDWLRDQADVIDTTDLTPGQAAEQIVRQLSDR